MYDLLKRYYKRQQDDTVKDEDVAVSRIATEIIDEWRPQSETFFIRNGYKILAFVAAASGFVAVKNVAALKIGTRVRRLTLLQQFVALTGSLTAFPLLISISFTELITRDILLKKTPCPLCVQTRSCGLQVLFGAIGTIGWSTIGVSLLFRDYVANNPKYNLQYVGKLIIQRNRPVFALAAVMNIFSALAVTQMAQKEMSFITDELERFKEVE